MLNGLFLVFFACVDADAYLSGSNLRFWVPLPQNRETIVTKFGTRINIAKNICGPVGSTEMFLCKLPAIVIEASPKMYMQMRVKNFK